MPRNPRKANAERIARLAALLDNQSTLLIVMQDHPDPDALASAVGLRALVNATTGIQCSVVHGGQIGRAENRALAKYVAINLRQVNQVEIGRFDLVALVDTQPGTGNNSLPEGIVPDIVIDHHPIHKVTRKSPFTDIRSRYGATSTILYEYLIEAGGDIDVTLATALLYGIRSDTQDLGRETTQADIDAFVSLYPRANKRMLSRIESERVPDDYFELLARALRGALIYGKAIVAGLGTLDTPDMIAEVADLLLRREGTLWVLCYGEYDGQILFSLRTSEPKANAGHVARRLAGHNGSGGGHNALAAGRVPLGGTTRKAAEQARTVLLGQFKRALNLPDKPGVRLVSK